MKYNIPQKPYEAIARELAEQFSNIFGKSDDNKLEGLCEQTPRYVKFFKDEPGENEGKLSLYTDAEWELLVEARLARKYNLDILRGKTRGNGKGKIQAGQDYENVQGIYNGLVKGRRYSDSEAEGQKQRVSLLL